MKTLKFKAFSSEVELPFYTSLASHKLNHDGLRDDARRVLGFYELRSVDPDRSCALQLHANSLTSDDVPTGLYRAEGTIRNVNTIEDYRNLNRDTIMKGAGRQIWDAIQDGTIFSIPSLLASFWVIMFADLKKYKYTYHFAFPALHSEPSWIIDDEALGGDESVRSPARASTSFLPDESTALVESVQTWRYSSDPRQWGFFLAKRDRGMKEDAGPFETEEDGVLPEPRTPGTPGPNLGCQWKIGPLSAFETGFFWGVEKEDQYICFADPSTLKENPGWMLRNLLVLVRQRWKLKKAQILCYRELHARRHEARSLVLKLKLSQDAPLTTEMPKVTGWERDQNNRLSSRMANLGEYMDPTRLADQAVDLNLKLIKWRISPNLELDRIAKTKCLLLGAGTLGSYVARNLLGWGVRQVTFVDNGRVSFSNPVRQPLFGFKDCLNGGQKKAEQAAAALKEIYPGVEAEGHVISVPMAGHPIIDESNTKAEYELLHNLIDSHDAIFLLLDSREARWLPTVMAKAADKLVINAALGFDSYVVMRHGSKAADPPNTELGCYFCSDVVAPADSVSNQALDQQCTVTRPGGAAIASAYAVELMVSILQHPLRASAPMPDVKKLPGKDEHPLGIVPHQIRGLLANFSTIVVGQKCYDKCSACSEGIQAAYMTQGWEFVKRALNEKGYVEELSGLSELQKAAELADADVDWEGEEDAPTIEALDGEGELI